MCLFYFFFAFSSPEAALLLVSTKKSRPLAMSNTGSPQFTDFPSLCACSESSLTNLIGSGLNLLCFQSHSKTECRWTGPEVAILGADQKERGLWERECFFRCLLHSSVPKENKPPQQRPLKLLLISGTMALLVTSKSPCISLREGKNNNNNNISNSK